MRVGGGEHFPGLTLAPIPGRAVVSRRGRDLPAGWERRRGSAGRGGCAPHTGLCMWSQKLFPSCTGHTGEGKAEREELSGGSSICLKKSDRSGLSPTACGLGHPKHMRWGHANPPGLPCCRQPRVRHLPCPNSSSPLLQQDWGRHFGFSIYHVYLTALSVSSRSR